MDRMKELFSLVVDMIEGKIQPTTALFDCKMMGMFPTTVEPLRTYVDSLFELEKEPDIISLSIGYSFPFGDALGMGTKIVAITDNNMDKAKSLSRELGLKLYSMRKEISPKMFSIEEGLDEAIKSSEIPVVIADIADNPGGGAGADSTYLLEAILNKKIQNVALGMIYDPTAVEMAKNAEVGAKIDLRVGGKIGKYSGMPLDLEVEVKTIQLQSFQKFRQGEEFFEVPIGDLVHVHTLGVDILLINERVQTFGIDPFKNCGIDLAKKKIVVVKSSNHFRDAYSKISQKILYVSAPGVCSGNFDSFDFKKMDKNRYPFVDNIEF
jgi:microcystin degradation protein MlrC